MMGRSLTASRDKTARLWEADSGSLLATFQGHDDVVQSAAFSADGQRVRGFSAAASWMRSDSKLESISPDQTRAPYRWLPAPATTETDTPAPGVSVLFFWPVRASGSWRPALARP